MLLSSSNEYLRALREGKYLQFLEWPQFIASHYAKEGSIQAADDLLNLLIFEWLNNGFCDDHVKQMAVLNAVYDIESSLFRENLAYSFAVLSITTLHCMVYENNNLKHSFICIEKMDRNEVNKWVTTNSGRLDEVTFNDYLLKQQSLFFTLSSTVNTRTVEAAYREISSVARLRNVLDDYILTLESTAIRDDKLRLSRLSVLKKFGVFLKEQSELTLQVNNSITEYVNLVREMQPADFEKEFLNSMLPLSFESNTLRVMTDWGLGFFSLLQKPVLALTAEPVPSDPSDHLKK